jgi:hypothetical protein
VGFLPYRPLDNPDIGAPIEGIMGIGIIITDGDIILPHHLLFFCHHHLLFFCHPLRLHQAFGFFPAHTTAAAGDNKGNLGLLGSSGLFSVGKRTGSPS